MYSCKMNGSDFSSSCASFLVVISALVNDDWVKPS